MTLKISWCQIVNDLILLSSRTLHFSCAFVKIFVYSCGKVENLIFLGADWEMFFLLPNILLVYKCVNIRIYFCNFLYKYLFRYLLGKVQLGQVSINYIGDQKSFFYIFLCLVTSHLCALVTPKTSYEALPRGLLSAQCSGVGMFQSVL